MAESDDFVLVKSKKKNKRHRSNKSVQCVTESPRATSCIENDKDVDYGRIKTKTSTLREQLKSSDFYTTVFDQIRKCCSYKLKMKDDDRGSAELKKGCDGNVADAVGKQLAGLSLTDYTITPNHAPSMECVCYGLGSIASCLIAQYQLAFCLALRDDLGLSSHHFSVFDPVFTDGEKKLLQDLYFDVIHINEEGKRACFVPTLFFMPHCGKALYNNLLWKNWHPDRLQNMIIIGNSFSAMIERTPKRILKETGSYILKIHSYTTEIPVTSCFQHGDVFNDLSIHHFPRDKLRTVPPDMWKSCGEPVYSQVDAEIIFNK